MTDIIDKATELEELDRAVALAAAKQDAPPAEANGACFLCDEPLPVGQRWCGPDCRDRYEAEVKARRLFPPVVG